MWTWVGLVKDGLDLEEVVRSARGVGKHRSWRPRRSHLVIPKYRVQRHGKGRGRHTLRVHGVKLFDVAHDSSNLGAERFDLPGFKTNMGETGEVLDVVRGNRQGLLQASAGARL